MIITVNVTVLHGLGYFIDRKQFHSVMKNKALQGNCVNKKLETETCRQMEKKICQNKIQFKDLMVRGASVVFMTIDLIFLLIFDV